MKWSGFSLGKMMFAVAILAADFALFYHLDYLGDVFGYGMTLVVGLLPMANIIVLGLPRLLRLGLPRLLRHGRRTPFAIGFQVTSWAATFAVTAIFVAKIEDLLDSMPWLFGIKFPQPIYGLPIVQPPVALFESCCNALVSLCETEDWASLATLMAFFSLPPLLLSVAGGLVARSVVRFRSRSVSLSRVPGTAVIDPIA